MEQTPRILVLMATHNAQTYLHDQLKSIFAQQDVELVLHVADASSQDNTCRILETFADEHQNMQLTFRTDGDDAQAVFADLVYSVSVEDYDFIAFAGQADVWRPGRLVEGTQRITGNTSRPELYYANVRNIDARGRTLDYGHADYRVCAAHPLSLLVAPNWALGCTMLMNGALVKLLRMHRAYNFGRSFDTWVHAVALLGGGFVYSDLAHHFVARRVLPAMKLGEDRLPKDTMQGKRRFAQLLLREFEFDMPPEALAVVRDVAASVESHAARQRLSRNKELCLPTPAATRRMRADLRRGRF